MKQLAIDAMSVAVIVTIFAMLASILYVAGYDHGFRDGEISKRKEIKGW